MSDNALQSKIESGISDALATDDRMLNRFVLIVEQFMGDGQRTAEVFTSDDIRVWDIIGLTEWALCDVRAQSVFNPDRDGN